MVLLQHSEQALISPSQSALTVLFIHIFQLMIMKHECRFHKYFKLFQVFKNYFIYKFVDVKLSSNFLFIEDLWLIF